MRLISVLLLFILAASCATADMDVRIRRNPVNPGFTLMLRGQDQSGLTNNLTAYSMTSDNRTQVSSFVGAQAGGTTGSPNYVVISANSNDLIVLPPNIFSETITNPNDFDNSYWAKSSCTISPNATTDINGSLIADMFDSSADPSNGRISHTFSGGVVGKTYIFSCYFKAVSQNNTVIGSRIRLQSAPATNYDAVVTINTTTWTKLSIVYTERSINENAIIYPINKQISGVTATLNYVYMCGASLKQIAPFQEYTSLNMAIFKNGTQYTSGGYPGFAVIPTTSSGISMDLYQQDFRKAELDGYPVYLWNPTANTYINQFGVSAVNSGLTTTSNNGLPYWNLRANNGGIKLVSANRQYISSTINAVANSVVIDVNVNNTLSDSLIKLNSTTNIAIINNTVSVNSWAESTVYVDGVPTTAITTGRHTVIVSSFVSINATTVIIGSANANYSNSIFYSVKVYPYAVIGIRSKLNFRGIADTALPHPFLYVDNDLINYARTKTDDLSTYSTYVKATFETDTNDPLATATIRAEVDRRCGVTYTHVSYYPQYAMAYGVNGYINNNALSKEYGHQLLLELLSQPLDYPGGTEDGPPRGKLFALSALYDWLFDSFSDEEKRLTRAYILDLLDYNDAVYNSFTGAGVAGGHQQLANGYALQAIISIKNEIRKDDATIQSRFNYWLNKMQNNYTLILNPGQDFIAADGGHQMGWAYGLSYKDYTPYFVAKYGNNSASWFKDWQDKTADFYLYGLRNSGNATFRTAGGYDNYPYAGDVWWTYYENDFQGRPLVTAASIYGNESAKWLYGKLRDSVTWTDLLYRNYSDSGITPNASILPMAKNFGNSGYVVMRDSWDIGNNSNTLLTFKSSKFYSINHHHKDQNAFEIYYKAPLAIDSGQYNYMGGYGSKHWWNYYTRSVAHNTVTVYNPTESYGTSGYGKNSNDGGQKFFATEYPTLAQMQEGGSNHLDGIVFFETSTNYTYTQGRAGKAYDSNKVTTFNRSLVHLPNHSYTHPAIVVYDKVVATNGSFKKTYLLHMMNTPNVNGDDVTITANDGININNVSTLYQRTILPFTPNIISIGGTGNEFFVWDDGNGATHNYKEGLTALDATGIRSMRESGQWRVEVSAPTGNLDDRFLHVLSIADSPTTANQVASEYFGDTYFDGCIINDADGVEKTAVMFQKDDPAAFTFSIIEITAKMDFNKIIITGLVPGRGYNVYKSGTSPRFLTISTGNAYTASDQGVIYVEL